LGETPQGRRLGWGGLVAWFHFICGAVGLAIHYLGHKRQPLKSWGGVGGIKAHMSFYLPHFSAVFSVLIVGFA
jgi:hypothetical protein